MHSYARPEEARVQHVALDLRIDFESRTLSGTATLTLVRVPSAERVILDVKDLVIESVADDGGASLPFESGARDPILGSPLAVSLRPDTTQVVVRYRTPPDAAALQWLSPEQTAGKKHPFLFSQGQAILTRTWIPTQDSPGIRHTYSARIIVPEPLTAVMSAEVRRPGPASMQSTRSGPGLPASTQTTRNGPGERAFDFAQEHPIPAYLIAIAVGDLAFADVRPRTGVYTEPAMLARAANEFVDMEKMVQAAERLYGAYRWGRFDVLVLPPSFPFGGMENPRLTFATPTIIAGDRSLTSVIAHELAHSWSGNLVTNATWSDFWLNEGFTTYFENRIMEELYGPERAAMLRVIGRRELLEEFDRLKDKPRDTALYVDLEGRDPDDAATGVPYEKGAAFVRMLELAVGRARFDAYLRSYFDQYAFQSMSTETFIDDLRNRLFGGDRDIEHRLKIREWICEPGLPSNAPVETSAALERVESAAKSFAEGAPVTSIDARGWSTQEWIHFVTSLPATISPAQLTTLDRTFELSERGNSEVLFVWLRLAIRQHYQPAMPALETFLATQGRRKFVKPLFEELLKTDWGRPVAERIFAKAKPLYHSLTRTSVEELLQKPD